ncbi:hypothetical protein Hanom_Chr16g01465291 [Helianthus anomalus]
MLAWFGSVCKQTKHKQMSTRLDSTRINFYPIKQDVHTTHVILHRVHHFMQKPFHSTVLVHTMKPNHECEPSLMTWTNQWPKLNMNDLNAKFNSY